MLKKSLESVLTSQESNELISAFDQVGNIIVVRIPDSLLSKKKIIGLEAKLAQYAQGEEFIAAVEKAGGEELFNQVWIEPSHLPNSEEIKQPSLWINRMQVKTSG